MADEDVVDHHKRLNLHQWPKKRYPTPIEIFNLDAADLSKSPLEMKKILKKTYVAYVKLYHPDASKNLQIYHENGKELSDAVKRQRFDQVQDAYNILKDPRRRVAYNRYASSNWDNNNQPYNRNTEPFSKQNFEAFRRAQAHRTAYDFKNNEEFWQAGTWDDYYKMKYNRAPPTREELEKNKYKILAGVLIVAALAFSLQVMMALDKTNDYYIQNRLMNLRSMEDLQNSTDNYGEGLNNMDRVRRFLISRRSSLLVKDVGEIQGNDKEMKEEDNEILVKYVQRNWDKET
ncbi:uncharacterized protein RJT20DRAFT_134113 [Scheffersomyces xylosifermentans]|uniref:uncharacterized protein n=1 Tax=Scheffersomyces xylosifermentans TaxID=1304137 RepID=UPI00315DD689